MPVPPPPKPRKPPVRGALSELMAVVGGATPLHADLRSRLVGVALISVVLDLAAGAVALSLEHGHGEIHNYGEALFWTTTQMLTVSSQVPNPLTTGGRILDVILEIYAVTVVTSLAGVFGAFFHHRTTQRMKATH